MSSFGRSHDEDVVEQLKSYTRKSGGRLLVSAEYDYIHDQIKIGRFTIRVDPELLGLLVESNDTGAKVIIRIEPGE